MRILGITRFWRVFRLVNTLLNEEIAKHETTKQKLENEQTVRYFTLLYSWLLIIMPNCVRNPNRMKMISIIYKKV